MAASVRRKQTSHTAQLSATSTWSSLGNYGRCITRPAV